MVTESTLNYKKNHERMMKNYENRDTKVLSKGLGRKTEDNEGEEQLTMLDLLQETFNDIVDQNRALENKNFLEEEEENVNR
jgi:hypothetical protein|tara:strand:+ start:111 stop:353 length:243 start_codon:yes stop_codon:yes gene_type:complete